MSVPRRTIMLTEAALRDYALTRWYRATSEVLAVLGCEQEQAALTSVWEAEHALGSGPGALLLGLLRIVAEVAQDLDENATQVSGPESTVPRPKQVPGPASKVSGQKTRDPQRGTRDSYRATLRKT